MRRWAARFAISLFLPLLFCTSCNQNSPSPPNTLRLTFADDIKTLDPPNMIDEASLMIGPAIFESLLHYTYLRSELVPSPQLADGMPAYSSDQKTVTIRIKKNVRFQDDPCFRETQGKGRELTAHDFVYAWKRMAHPGVQAQSFWVFDQKLVGFNAFHDALIAARDPAERKKIFDAGFEGAQALDAHTLKLKLTSPYPQLNHVLGMPITAPVAHEAVDQYADPRGNVTDHPIGTGAFMLKSWKRNRRVTLVRNPRFRQETYPTEADPEFKKRSFLLDQGKPIPALEQIELDIIHESQPQWLSFIQGGIDVVRVPKDRFQQVITNHVNLVPELRSKGIRLEIEPGGAFYYITFNMRDPLVGKNKYLRQALASAIDREKWIDTFTNGTGRKMTHALPYGIQGRSEGEYKFDFNLNRAKELLAKAGYPEGKGLKPIVFDMRGADSTARQLTDFFSQQWAKIGVKTTIVLNTFPAWLEKQKNANFQVGYGGWALDYPDAQNVYQLLVGRNQAPGQNESNFDNPEFNKLYEQMETMLPGPKRTELIRRMEAIVQEESPWAYGYYHTYYHLIQPWVFNYRATEMIMDKLKYVRVNPETRGRYLNGH